MPSASVLKNNKQQTYDRLLESFRHDGENYQAAGRAAGVNWRTAKLVYLKGWVGKPWARPIREVLEEEKARAYGVVAARAERERQLAETARAQAAQMAIEAKAAETEILAKCRKVVLEVLANSEELRAPMAVLVKVVHAKVRDAVMDLVADPTGKTPKPANLIDIDAADAMKIIDRHTRMTARVVAVAEDIIQVGRTDRGEANTIVGHTIADMTAEEAAEEIDAQEQAISIIRREGSRGVH